MAAQADAAAITATLGKAAGLDPFEATGRTLWLGPTA